MVQHISQGRKAAYIPKKNGEAVVNHTPRLPPVTGRTHCDYHDLCYNGWWFQIVLFSPMLTNIFFYNGWQSQPPTAISFWGWRSANVAVIRSSTRGSVMWEDSVGTTRNPNTRPLVLAGSVRLGHESSQIIVTIGQAKWWFSLEILPKKDLIKV